MPNRPRPTFLESGQGVPLSSIQEKIGLPISFLQNLIVESSQRFRRELRLRGEPFTVSDGKVHALGIAGVARLAPNVEIEIIPKYLNPSCPDWHDDFLMVAAATRLGRIFRREQVASSNRSEHRDVLSLLATMFLGELEKLIHVPIREYRRYTRIDTNLDGELDYAEVWDVRPEGFAQVGPILSINNEFMGAIGEAASYLADSCADKSTGLRLRRLVSGLPNSVRGKKRDRVPGRYARWQRLYSLAIDVLAGLGIRLGPSGELRVPGFILNTERGWEDLLTLALISQGSFLRARVKPASQLGIRMPSLRKVVTYPDLVLTPPSLHEPVIIDAKYKGTAAVPIQSISSEDLYEALAFLTAQQCSTAILIYPVCTLSSSDSEPGALTQFDEVEIASNRIIGATMTIQGVGHTQGFADLGRRAGQGILEFARPKVTNVT
ncbi:MAG: hypothetical protein OXF62_11680 [Caldilineaceae bacterium]|nr:hypothetical protein [Caldilineaceae bacterium]